MNKNFLRPSSGIVALYSLLTWFCLHTNGSSSNSNLLFIPLYPWVALTSVFSQLSILLFFGYFLIFALNAFILYYLTLKYLKSPPEWILTFPITLTAGYLIWAIDVAYYALHCTEKLCGLALVMPTSPTMFALVALDLDPTDNNLFAYLVIALNALILFGISFWLETRRIKRMRYTAK